MNAVALPLTLTMPATKAFWLGLVERWQALELREAQQSVRDKSRPPLRRRPELARDSRQVEEA
jgi:hypothetical protein